jgi:heme/copper-type cytochrome/quinol oxidase subunit 1
MMKKEISTSSNNLQQVISFLLGASVASVILFFVLSTNQDSRYIEKSSWTSTSINSTSQKTSSTIVQVIDSKTPPPKELKGNETEFSTEEPEKSETKSSPPPKELKGNETEFSSEEPEKNVTKSFPKVERNETKASVKNEVNSRKFFFQSTVLF